MNLSDVDEAALREVNAPWPKTEDELLNVIKQLVERKHDYGTCVYAMSIAAVTAFHYVAHKLGATGFQASCADLDIIRRTRHIENGFQIVKYDDLLYPQYRYKFAELSWDALIEANATSLKKAAEKKLVETQDAHPDVIAHWKYLASLQPKKD